MKNCNACERCERMDKETETCYAFITRPKKCWAWTSDPNWYEKIREDTKKYRQYKNQQIGKYWR